MIKNDFIKSSSETFSNTTQITKIIFIVLEKKKKCEEYD